MASDLTMLPVIEPTAPDLMTTDPYGDLVLLGLLPGVVSPAGRRRTHDELLIEDLDAAGPDWPALFEVCFISPLPTMVDASSRHAAA